MSSGLRLFEKDENPEDDQDENSQAKIRKPSYGDAPQRQDLLLTKGTRSDRMISDKHSCSQTTDRYMQIST